jgi:murein DD-endopeptidase MepM/ murein hydrolase activator NlpD
LLNKKLHFCATLFIAFFLLGSFSLIAFKPLASEAAEQKKAVTKKTKKNNSNEVKKEEVYKEPEGLSDPETIEIVAAKGESFTSIFSKRGYEKETITALSQTINKSGSFNTRSLKEGQKLTLTEKKTAAGKPYISQLEIFTSKVKLIVKPDSSKKFKLSKQDRPLTTKFVYKRGTISSSLGALADRIGLPREMMQRSISILSNRVNFQKDVKRNDKFYVLYEALYDQEGKFVNYGKILYTGVIMGKTKISSYMFDMGKGRTEYFDESGKGYTQTITNRPLKGNFRVTSGFGTRRHPVLRKMMLHSGTDFAAPSGTPIYAAGDGVVTKTGRFGGYGNYLRIRHDRVFETAYGHLRSFAKGMRPGLRVKKGELIGYVGNTGRSTGNHLHFEVIQRGKAVNSERVKLPSGGGLTGKQLKNFKNRTTEVKNIINNIIKQERARN